MTYEDLVSERIARIQRGDNAIEVNKWFNHEKERMSAHFKQLERKPVPLDVHKSPNPIPHFILPDSFMNDVVMVNGKYVI